MGRVEKKFQKKKEREREVRKKILKKREAAHALSKQIEAQDKLEREVNKTERKKQQPIRNSPELKQALDLLEKIPMSEEKNKVLANRTGGKTTTTALDAIRGRTTNVVMIDDTSEPVVGFTPEPGK